MNNRRISRPESVVAPSWSWASVAGPVSAMPQWDQCTTEEVNRRLKPDELGDIPLCEVLNKHALGTKDTPYFSQEVLKIRGYLCPIFFVTQNEVCTWGGATRQFGRRGADMGWGMGDPWDEVGHRNRETDLTNGDIPDREEQTKEDGKPEDSRERPAMGEQVDDIVNMWPLTVANYSWSKWDGDKITYAKYYGNPTQTVLVSSIMGSQEASFKVQLVYDIAGEHQTQEERWLMPGYGVTARGKRHVRDEDIPIHQRADIEGRRQ